MKFHIFNRLLYLSIFNLICFAICVLVFSLINREIFHAVVYLPIGLLILFIAIRVYVKSLFNIKNNFHYYLDTIELIFYFWAILVIEHDLFFIFILNHLIIAAIRGTKLYDLIQQVGILFGIILCSILKQVRFSKDWDVVISSVILQLLCAATAIAIGKLIRKLHVDDIKKLKEYKKRIQSQNLILSTLSHELRTPLTMIKSSSEILIEERPGKVNDLQKTFLKTVVRNTIRLIEITENILARIKIETTWLKLKLVPLDIRSVIRDVISQMDPVLRQEKKEIGFTHPKLISKVMADENWLAQVMINLIHNSKKNVGIKGRILVNVKENEQFIVVSVSDDGKGIKDKHKELVYDEFYSENSDANGVVEGVGMGLAIVKFVIEKHGGKVYLGSIAGLGTTFSFALKKQEESK